MKPYHITMIGLIVDILGAFFVSAEAIKLDNLRTLKNTVLKPMHKATLSPKIEFIGDHMVIQASRKFVFLFTALHYVAGIFLLVAVNLLLDGKLIKWGEMGAMWLFSQQWYWIVLGVIVAVFYGVVGGLWMLGELVHMTITHITRISVKTIEFVEIRTPDGTVGIIGFSLLLVGFIIQMIGTYLAGHK